MAEHPDDTEQGELVAVRQIDDYLNNITRLEMDSCRKIPRMVGFHNYRNLIYSLSNKSSYAPSFTDHLNYVIERVCSKDPGYIFLKTLDLEKYSNCSENIKILYQVPLNYGPRLELRCPDIVKDKIKLKFANEQMSSAQLETMSHEYGEKCRKKILKQIKKMSRRIPFINDSSELDSYGIKSHRMVIILGLPVFNLYKALLDRPIPYGYVSALACTPLGSALMLIDLKFVQRMEKSMMKNKFFRFWNTVGTSLFL